jgi:protein SCO1/2
MPILAASAASSLTDEQLLQIKFDQKPGSQVSSALTFRDENGKQVRLGDYFSKRPVILMLGYYGCPMLCTLTLNGATESLRDLKWSAGQQFDVVFVSIDPAETPALAAAKKKTYLRDYGRAGSADGWHFLTGNALSIKTLADEIGFHYAYDPALKEFAHPSGFVVLAPDGRVVHYFFGVTFSPDEVDKALRDASREKIDSPVQELILLCCEYSPFRGRYSGAVMDIVRAGGIGTVFALGLYFVRPGNRRFRSSK